MRPYRSLLFVPGHKEGWADKAVGAGSHAVILDLEDAVPAGVKDEARRAVGAVVDDLARRPRQVGVIVRVNPLESRDFGRDVSAVVRPGLTALLLPKVYGAAEVIAFDALVTAAEIERGLPRGGIGLIPSLETARSIAAVDSIIGASPRVVSVMAAAAKGTDVAREVGFHWTPEGLETLYLRSRIVLAARAAGLPHVVLGLWQDIRDLEGLRSFAEANRRLGFGGQVLIHPSHVATVNEVYAPSPEQIAWYRRIVDAYERAAASGHGAVTVDGEHIDLAHVQYARQVLMADERPERGAPR